MSKKRKVAPFYEELLKGLPDGFIPLEAVITVKAISDDGEVCLASYRTPSLSYWEATGMLYSAVEDMRPAYEESE